MSYLSKSNAVGLSFCFSLMAATNAVQAEAPPKGSEQWNMLAPYVDFVRAMTRPSGTSCCDLSDGRGELAERVKGDRYLVKVTKDLYPNANIPPEGLWIDVGPADVLSSEHANKMCEQFKAIKGHTCYRPPFNVLWLNISTLKPYCYIPKPAIF